MRASKKNARYGWIPDLPDQRDLKYAVTKPIRPDLPSIIDLRAHCPAVYDQGEMGSCTANAIAAAFEFELLKQGKPDFSPSRLFIYYNERSIEGDVKTDGGAMLRDGMKSVAKSGVCNENLWPYSVHNLLKKPGKDCYLTALSNQVEQYVSLDNSDLNQLKSCLYEGYPFVFGFTVYESFESPKVAEDGLVPMPRLHERVLGGHAVMAVGYDDSKHAFIVRNSWGIDWGIKGYFYMPYQYLVNADLADDFWTIRLVE